MFDKKGSFKKIRNEPHEQTVFTSEIKKFLNSWVDVFFCFRFH